MCVSAFVCACVCVCVYFRFYFYLPCLAGGKHLTPPTTDLSESVCNHLQQTLTPTPTLTDLSKPVRERNSASERRRQHVERAVDDEIAWKQVVKSLEWNGMRFPESRGDLECTEVGG